MSVEIVFHHQPYSRKICTFHFGDHHLGFLAGFRRHAIPEVAPLKRIYPENMGIAGGIL